MFADSHPQPQFVWKFPDRRLLSGWGPFADLLLYSCIAVQLAATSLLPLLLSRSFRRSFVGVVMRSE